ncbi:MAG: hypothetical protein MZV70_54545 [Desulfobacterales bacterium]|nr:hypothetical protein [Desulfobacterales bacterium]
MAKIVTAKNWRGMYNPNGKMMPFKIIGGWQVPLTTELMEVPRGRRDRCQGWSYFNEKVAKQKMAEFKFNVKQADKVPARVPDRGTLQARALCGWSIRRAISRRPQPATRRHGTWGTSISRRPTSRPTSGTSFPTASGTMDNKNMYGRELTPREIPLVQVRQGTHARAGGGHEEVYAPGSCWGKDRRHDLLLFVRTRSIKVGIDFAVRRSWVVSTCGTWPRTS